MKFDSWVIEVILIFFSILVFREACIVWGKEKANIFLWGSILWTGTIENLMVVTGAYDYFAYANYYKAGEKIIDGYSGWIGMVVFVPLCVCLGWFLLSVPALIVSNRCLGKKSNIWIKSGFAAIFLVSFDMLLDPVSVVNEWWRWTVPGFYFRGVTVGNYIGWFFLLFFFGAIFEQTVLQLKGFRGFSFVERLVFKMDTLDLSTASTSTVKKIFYFRLLMFLPVFLVVSGIAARFVSNHYANNIGPFNHVFPLIR